MGQNDEETSSPPWRISLRKSCNPYAAHYYEPQDPPPAIESGRQQFRAAQNPYALHYYVETEPKSGTTRESLPKLTKPVVERKSISKADFESGCRSIFRRYMPEMERTKLRSHHQDFIHRNLNCSPERRHALLQALCRYDLSNESGLRTYFNLEEDTFTEAKLLQLEASVKED